MENNNIKNESLNLQVERMFAKRGINLLHSEIQSKQNDAETTLKEKILEQINNKPNEQIDRPEERTVKVVTNIQKKLNQQSRNKLKLKDFKKESIATTLKIAKEYAAEALHSHMQDTLDMPPIVTFNTTLDFLDDIILENKDLSNETSKEIKNFLQTHNQTFKEEEINKVEEQIRIRRGERETMPPAKPTTPTTPMTTTETPEAVTTTTKAQDANTTEAINTTEATTPITNSTTGTPRINNEDNPDNNTPEIVGGVIAGLAVLALATYCCLKKRKNKVTSQQEGPNQMTKFPAAQALNNTRDHSLA